VTKESDLIQQIIKEFKLWLKEIKGGSENVKEERWRDTFFILETFVNYDDIEGIKKFVEVETGKRKGWSDLNYFLMNQGQNICLNS